MRPKVDSLPLVFSFFHTDPSFVIVSIPRNSAGENWEHSRQSQIGTISITWLEYIFVLLLSMAWFPNFCAFVNHFSIIQYS